MTGTIRTDIVSQVERASEMLARIAQHAESPEPIRHGSNGFVFIRIGIKYESRIVEGVQFPILAYSEKRREYVFAHHLIWGGDEYGFCWDSGTYFDLTDWDDALKTFLKECDEVVYTAN